MKKYKIYDNVLIGKNARIHDHAIIGRPPRGFNDGDLYTRIGMDAVIREFTVIYSSTRIGNSFQSGIGAKIPAYFCIQTNIGALYILFADVFISETKAITI